jgi:hypothetical protein
VLPASDQHCLRAAEGWLDLGNANEASLELDRIGPEHRHDPDVLNLRWQIHRKTKNWDACFEVATSFTNAAPKDPRAWTSLAQTYYYTKRVDQAYDLALSKITTFPKHWPLYYDAACYACLTGRLTQARQFLQLASALGNTQEVQRLAAEDPDLEALRQEV